MRFKDLLPMLALSTSSLFFPTPALFVERRPKLLHPVIEDFQEFIESNPGILVGFTLMFDQIPNTAEGQLDFASSGPQVRDYHTMLARINEILTTAPSFMGSAVPFPFMTLLGWPMCTQAGFDMFMNPKVNDHLRQILKTWAQFLESPDSRYVLTNDTGGWFSEAALKAMPNFAQTYECDPEKEFYGFASWDDFFTRRLRDGARPVDAPEDKNVINHACESLPFRIRHDVKEKDKFWLKGQPYSLAHMLNNDPLAPQFVGGTVFQSFLSGSNYHRWHSPVDGTVVKIEAVPGTFFAISPADDNPRDGVKDGFSEAFSSNVATRMIIFIQAENPKIGLMVFMAVGLVEFSSCEATVGAGDRVRKGDELGMFHVGGSTYLMIFRPETRISFDKDVYDIIGGDTFPEGKAILVNKRIGFVQTAQLTEQELYPPQE